MVSPKCQNAIQKRDISHYFKNASKNDNSKILTSPFLVKQIVMKIQAGSL